MSLITTYQKIRVQIALLREISVREGRLIQFYLSHICLITAISWLYKETSWGRCLDKSLWKYLNYERTPKLFIFSKLRKYLVCCYKKIPLNSSENNEKWKATVMSWFALYFAFEHTLLLGTVIIVLTTII